VVSESEFELILMEGGFTLGGDVCRPGYFRFVPRGVSLPALHSEKGCTMLLMYNDSIPNQRESDVDMDGADRAGLVSLHTYDDIPWQYPTQNPGVEPGCLIKILRFDPKTFAMSFLYNMIPGFWQDNISYHDCCEEGYHIWGTSWIMQFGDLPAGGYFWRPPYISHGPFACEYGCIAFGRTDAELFNHFHWDVNTTPLQNAERSAARIRHRKPELFQWLKTSGNDKPQDWDYPDFRP
jgi:Domain of unknown function (DUF4437)